MKTFLAIISFIGALSFSGDANAQTQAEMTQQAIDAFKKTDAQLNTVYRELSEKIDQGAREKLKIAQRAWVAFRDAQANFESENEASGGTMFTQLVYSSRTELTETRIEQLKAAIPKA